MERLEESYAFWRGHLAQATELDTPLGPIAGPYAEGSRRSFLLHELDELIHHGAEVGLLRDLYAASRPRSPVVTAALDADRPALESLIAADPDLREQHPGLMTRAAAVQRWDAVALLIDLDFPVDPPRGVAPIHYAAGAGELDVVRLLVDHGANLNARDLSFNETPRGWAASSGRDEVVDALDRCS